MNLYKKDSKGKIRYLNVYVNGSQLIQESGLLGTDSPIVHSKECKGKNVGRSNETTPEQQAILERNSKVEEKLTEGYFKELDELQTANVILPMLAKSYKDEKDKVDWNDAYGQPKLDGMRCLAFKEKRVVVLKSRDGKYIQNMGHIIDALKDLPEGVVLDGELYKHGSNFQENMRLIKKYREGETEKIQYHVYDTISELPYNLRNGLYDGLAGVQHVIQVPTFRITSEQELVVLHADFLERGFEGTMIRWGDAGYKVNARSSNLLKYKDFLDLACMIVDIEPAERRPDWGVPVLEYNGKRFRANARLSHDERRELLANKNDYIGKTAEIRFFEYSEDGIPRFPVMVGIRLDK